MGVNYTMLRYACPLLFVLIVYRIGRTDARWKTTLFAALIAAVFTAVLFLISPEVAVAYLFACAVILFPRGRSRTSASTNLSYLLGVALLLSVAYGAFRLHIIDSLLLDGGGANSFPLAPGPAILAFCGAVFVGACYVTRRLVSQEKPDNSIALLAFALPMTVAALSRCDPAHLLFNGLGLFISALFYLSVSELRWQIAALTFSVGLVGMYVFVFVLGMLVSRPGPGFPIFPKNADIASLYAVNSRNVSDPLFEAPFGYEPKAIGFALAPQIDYGFFYGTADANTPAAVALKIRELALHPKRSLLLPADFEPNFCSVDENKEQTIVSVLLGVNYSRNVAHPDSIRKPLCSYINSRYQRVAPADPANFGYELWSPLNATAVVSSGDR